jgi:hypothetical protein
MKVFQNPFKRRSPLVPGSLAERFLHLFDAHNVHRSQIPRLIRQIRPADLQSEARLLEALTVDVIDATSQLFGVRREWLEGVDDLMFYPLWDRGNPMSVLHRLACVVASAGVESSLSRFPLRVLTTSKILNPALTHQQWLLPVIVEPVSDFVESPVNRCWVSEDHFDWTNSQSRLELKAITWLILHRLKTQVPLFQVSQEELSSINMGMAIPSIVLRAPLMSDPSLEDFVMSHKGSRVAKETEELPAVLDYLDAQGLRDFKFEIPAPASVVASEEVAPQEPPSAIPDAPESKKPSRGKRQAQQVNWSAILTAAQTTWAKAPFISFAKMIEDLKSMPHLKASALSNSAIHKHLREIAPPEVRGKPGRKPNQSA